MRKFVSIAIMICILGCVVSSAIAIEGDVNDCPVCGKRTMWNEKCSGQVASRSAYTFHVLTDGTVCNKYTATVYDARFCKECGNRYVYSTKHNHVIHSICATEYECRYR